MPWTWIHAWRTHLRTLAQGVRRRPQKRSRPQSRHDLLNRIASDALDLDSRLADASSDAGARRKTPSSETVAPAKPARPPKTWIHAWRTHLRTLAQGVRRRPQKRSRRQSRHDLLNGIASDALDLDSRLADASSDAGARRKT